MISKEIIVIALINIFFFSSLPVKAQYLSLPDTANFYDYLKEYYNLNVYYFPNDTSEGGGRAQFERLVNVWGPRLYPHGDFSIANKAIIDYAQNYTPVNVQTENPNWVCIGPSDNPINNTTFHGVGQIHRITFAPNYNGTTNKTIYACSGYGGLWRTETDGALWEIVNTDALPITSVGDIAINPNNTNTLFISTGHPDEGVTLTYSSNWSAVNPIYTIGIYRSTDYGATWNPINNGFINEFYLKGGTVRKLTINPGNPNVLFAATSNGVFRTENALATTPVWEKVFSGINGTDGDFRSVEFKPGSSNIIYAASSNIFKSTDGGDTWTVIPGLDFSSMGQFYPYRINLAVTPANSNKIYAYIWGDDDITNDTNSTVCIYLFNGTNWEQIAYKNSIDNSVQWMGLAVSPVDENAYFAYGNFGDGGAGVYGNYLTYGFLQYFGYGGPGWYPDVHVMVYQPNISNPRLFEGNHAGISVLNTTAGTSEFRNTGLQNMLHWTFDDSEFKSDIILTGN